MRTIFIGLLTLISLQVFAVEPEVYQYNIKGMKCADCVESVKKSVCGMNGVGKCDVTVGKMTLQAADGARLDQKAIAKAVKDAGHYSVKSFEKVETKN